MPLPLIPLVLGAGVLALVMKKKKPDFDADALVAKLYETFQAAVSSGKAFDPDVAGQLIEKLKEVNDPRWSTLEAMRSQAWAALHNSK
jgi:hypothetical protein